MTIPSYWCLDVSSDVSTEEQNICCWENLLIVLVEVESKGCEKALRIPLREGLNLLTVMQEKPCQNRYNKSWNWRILKRHIPQRYNKSLIPQRYGPFSCKEIANRQIWGVVEKAFQIGRSPSPSASLKSKDPNRRKDNLPSLPLPYYLPHPLSSLSVLHLQSKQYVRKSIGISWRTRTKL
ncbi:hypothetical protein SLEP1_g57498 [Rubroshorea leprosula]|uniref:Uncharacterized protein n=1 Tax=Rubroshorea leprosula TaxID=152421 RepID=A0AAV5MMN0_9ROSI|nr:hypothetical protein SLEP1_g57498 [Rubroshorea leprosula]